MAGRVFLVASALVCFALTIWCGAGPRAWAAQAGPAITLPVTTNAMKPQAAVGGQPKDSAPSASAASGAPVSKADARESGTPGKKKTAPRKTTLSRGFSSNPFALEHRRPERTERGKKPETRSGAQGERKEAEDAKITLSGKKNHMPDNRLVPYRSAFSGGPQTLSAMDHDPAPEVSMSYRLDKSTRAKAVINPQDETSPLYRPAETEGAINSAGVYLHLDVQPDLLLQIGGEYSEIPRQNARQDSSAGAAALLRWNF